MGWVRTFAGMGVDDYATGALRTIDCQSLIIADFTGRTLILGSDEHEANPLRLETKPQLSVTYESHLRTFFRTKKPQTRRIHDPINSFCARDSGAAVCG
jgi:hypothetical protein